MPKAGRGKNAQGKKKRWSDNRKAKEKAFITRQPLAISADGKPSLSRKAKKRAKWEAKKGKVKAGLAYKDSSQDGAPPRKKKRAAKVKRQDELGDTIVEHAFSDSDTEDEEAAAQRRQEGEAELGRRRRQIFVFGVSNAMGKRSARELFQSCGGIEAVDISKDIHDKPRLTVTFEVEEAVKKALEFHGRDHQARKLLVKPALVEKAGQEGSTQGKAKKAKQKGKKLPAANSSGSESDSELGDGGHAADQGVPGKKGKGGGKGGAKGSKNGKSKSKGKGKGKGKGKSKGRGKGKGNGHNNIPT